MESAQDLFIYSVSLVFGAQALATAGLIALHARHADHDRWTGAGAFALIAFLLATEAFDRLDIHDLWPLFTVVEVMAVFLLGPAILGLARSVSPFMRQGPDRWFLHGVPAVLSALILIPLILSETPAAAQALTRIWQLIWPVFVVHIGGYVAAALYAVFRDTHRLNDVFSFRGSGHELRLKRMLVMITLPWALLAVEEAASWVIDLSDPARIAFGLLRMASVLVVCLLAIYPEPLVPAPQTETPDRAPDGDGAHPAAGPAAVNGAYARASLDPQALERIADKIRKAMAEDQLYKNPLLTLQELSTHLRIPAHKLSQTMNVHMGKTFFDVVNDARVHDVLASMRQGRAETLLDLALDAGFNSKSTFNKAFKTVTGETPSSLRKRLDGAGRDQDGGELAAPDPARPDVSTP